MFCVDIEYKDDHHFGGFLHKRGPDTGKVLEILYFNKNYIYAYCVPSLHQMVFSIYVGMIYVYIP